MATLARKRRVSSHSTRPHKHVRHPHVQTPHLWPYQVLLRRQAHFLARHVQKLLAFHILVVCYGQQSTGIVREIIQGCLSEHPCGLAHRLVVFLGV